MIVLFFSEVIFAEENAQDIAQNAIKINTKSNKPIDTFELMAGLDKPPFIIEDDSSGLELDIFRAVFAHANIDVKFIHVPFGRTITNFKRLNADGIITVLPDYQHPSLFVSKPYITYQNVAVSLLDNQFEIDDIASLSGKSMIAFQNARKYLGEDFNKVISSAMDYREVAAQTKQIDMLFLRRTEVIVLDINIFKYFLKINKAGRFEQPFKIHYIFDERPYSAAFNTENKRDLFDSGIIKIKEQGMYQLIMDKYIK